VQIDFTEGWLATKIDPSGHLLNRFIELNNLALSRFPEGDRECIRVIATIDPRIETPEEVCDRVLEAAKYISLDQLGTTDDCGFSPFSDDTSTTRDTAFRKIEARVRGTALAERLIKGH
jgi:methionine synthase II (cobalamin-independent)